MGCHLKLSQHLSKQPGLAAHWGELYLCSQYQSAENPVLCHDRHQDGEEGGTEGR